MSATASQPSSLKHSAAGTAARHLIIVPNRSFSVRAEKILCRSLQPLEVGRQIELQSR